MIVLDFLKMGAVSVGRLPPRTGTKSDPRLGAERNEGDPVRGAAIIDPGEEVAMREAIGAAFAGIAIKVARSAALRR